MFGAFYFGQSQFASPPPPAGGGVAQEFFTIVVGRPGMRDAAHFPRHTVTATGSSTGGVRADATVPTVDALLPLADATEAVVTVGHHTARHRSSVRLVQLA